MLTIHNTDLSMQLLKDLGYPSHMINKAKLQGLNIEDFLNKHFIKNKRAALFPGDIADLLLIGNINDLPEDVVNNLIRTINDGPLKEALKRLPEYKGWPCGYHDYISGNSKPDFARYFKKEIPDVSKNKLEKFFNKHHLLVSEAIAEYNKGNLYNYSSSKTKAGA